MIRFICLFFIYYICISITSYAASGTLSTFNFSTNNCSNLNGNPSWNFSGNLVFDENDNGQSGALIRDYYAIIVFDSNNNPVTGVSTFQPLGTKTSPTYTGAQYISTPIGPSFTLRLYNTNSGNWNAPFADIIALGHYAEITITLQESTCDGIDNDCDSMIDEGLLATFYADTDGDGYGDPNNSTQACSQPAGFEADNTDCDDNERSTNPEAQEICDGIDNDCDGLVDDNDPSISGQQTWYEDSDGDGYGDPNLSLISCLQPNGYVADSSDDCPQVFGVMFDPCDDGDPRTIDDFIDENCQCVGGRTIPTLNQWGIIVLSMVMLILGLVFMKQRKVIFG